MFGPPSSERKLVGSNSPPLVIELEIAVFVKDMSISNRMKLHKKVDTISKYPKEASAL